MPVAPTLDAVSGSVNVCTAGDIGFKQFGLRRITRALHGNTFGVFAVFRASPPCCGPLALSRPGKAGGPEATSSRTSAP
jgi:hypothetical protein